jgi:outer membrane receptor protein involved in Fe transport
LQITRNTAFKAVLLAGGAGIMALAQPALAQEDEDTQNQTGDEVDVGPVADSEPDQPGIVVTGSRIQRQDFEANSPFVTVDEALLENSSTAALETSLNKLPQFVPAQTPTMGGDIQPTATNTPGAATVSLRGIGSNRNLVLIDSRRATPSNASGVVDISTIPSAAIERVEVISGGASATYGADAVAGVTNFILKKNFQGLELDAQAGLTEAGDGFEYQVSGIMGADFDDGRGNVSIAMSTNKREASFQRDNEFYQDLWADTSTTSGAQFFIENPGINFGANPPSQAAIEQVLPGATPPVPGFFTTFYTNPDGSVFTNGFGARGGVPFFNTPNDDNTIYKVTDAGTISQINTGFYQILPLTRYNMFARGNYEINDWIGVFGQGLYSHVETATRNEAGPIVGGWGVRIDPTALDRNQLPDELWTLLDSRTRAAGPSDPGFIAPTDANPRPVQPRISTANAPFDFTTLMPDERQTFTDVDTYNLTAGLEGSIPGSDWTWEAFAQFGESTTYAKQTGIYSLERVRAVMGAPNFGRGFSRQGNAAFGGFGASSATCTSGLNFFNPPAGGFSEDCLEAIRADLKNRSKVQQNIWEANLQGGLLELPAGEIRAAIGASYRELDYEFDNDTLTTQGRSFNDQALGIYPSGNVDAGFDVKEAYAETLIPVLADTFVDAFNLELGARLSDYSTTGTSFTYKILGDLEVTDWLRFRGGYNKAERAPNIGELFLAAQQTFGFNNVGDLCSKRNPAPFSANEDVNPNGAQVEAVCRVLMDQSGDPTADDEFYEQQLVDTNNDGQLDTLQYVNGAGSTASSGFAFPTTVGNENLRPETAKTWTAGVVLRSPFASPLLNRFRLSVDWFNIRVEDAIGVQSVGIAQRQCLQPEFNPLVLTDPAAAANSTFCQNITRNQQAGTLGNVFVTYVNNARFEVEGIDFQLDWGMDVGPGSLSVNALVNWLRKFEVSELPTDPMVDYAGTFGTTIAGLNQGAYDYRVLGTVNYSVGPARIGLQWQHLPSVEDSTEALFPTPTEGAPSYNIFHLNGGYALTENVNLRFGVENLFDKAPPYTGRNPANNQPAVNGQLPGGGYNAQFYDTVGRRFFVGANMKF